MFGDPAPEIPQSRPHSNRLGAAANVRSQSCIVVEVYIHDFATNGREGGAGCAFLSGSCPKSHEIAEKRLHIFCSDRAATLREHALRCEDRAVAFTGPSGQASAREVDISAQAEAAPSLRAPPRNAQRCPRAQRGDAHGDGGVWMQARGGACARDCAAPGQKDGRRCAHPVAAQPMKLSATPLGQSRAIFQAHTSQPRWSEGNREQDRARRRRRRHHWGRRRSSATSSQRVCPPTRRHAPRTATRWRAPTSWAHAP